MIYIASPYSDPDEQVRDERYTEVAAFCAAKVSEGFVVYSPIVHWHTIAVAANLPTDWSFWEKHNYTMLAKADELWIYGLPGWEKSKGIDAELLYWRTVLGREEVAHFVPES